MSPFPKCSICGHAHSKALAHIWDEEKPKPPSPTLEEIIEVTTKAGKIMFPDAEISRGDPGRGVAASVPDPVMVRVSKREDEVAARLPERHGIDAQSSHPPQSFESVRGAYQRIYMQDLPKAQAEGLTVKEWRKKHGVNWRDRI
ncbi:MAG: hypothetical protein E6R03_12915 [Hyphomicrobiaceae bacterium]|nr:MAG: hypothetical protein E6R03_12915 [Hyphomicrobiaceae bacterium]